MSKAQYFDSVLKKETDGKTSVVQGASIYIYDAGTVILSSLYENDGTTSKANPLTTDSNGNYSFRVDEGAYDIRIVYTGHDDTKNNVIVGSGGVDNVLYTLSSSTGLAGGGELSINTDTTKFDISDGSGYVVDNTTSTSSPSATFVSWTGLSAQSVTDILTQQSTNIAIDSTGSVIQQFASFTEQQHRDLIVLGGISHVDNVNVDSVFTETSPMSSPLNSVSDLAMALGFINIKGNKFSANGANLNINKSLGKTFAYGENIHNDAQTPHVVTNNALVAQGFLPVYQDGTGGTSFGSFDTTINPDSYDNGSGTLATVANNKFTIQRLFIYPNSNVQVVAYGQKEYSSITSAQDGISKDATSSLPQVTDSASLRGWLIVKKGTTDLSLSSNALFVSASKFGEIGETGISTATTTLQQAYDNSVNPELLTDSTLGALSIKRGSALDTDNIIEGVNGSGTNTFSVTGNGDITTAEITAPATPSTGNTVMYAKSDGLMYSKDDTGTETLMSSGAGGSGVFAQAHVVGSSGTPIASGTTNISSMTDTAVGRSRANFTVSASDLNYAALAMASTTSGNSQHIALEDPLVTRVTSSISIRLREDSGSGSSDQDGDYSLIVFEA